MPSRYDRRREAAALRADEVRSLLDSEGPPVDVEGLAKRMGLEVIYKPLEPNTSGVLVTKDANAVVGVNSAHHGNRRRFTIAHELGHFVLHADRPTVLVDEHLVHFRADRSSTLHDPRESEANAFAAALLMPEAWLRRDLADKRIDASDDLSVEQLADRYGVSKQALTIRLTNLDLLAF